MIVFFGWSLICVLLYLEFIFKLINVFRVFKFIIELLVVCYNMGGWWVVLL